jgi:hypothetical protein
VTFANVGRKGTTSIQSIATMAPPAGYRYGSPAAVFDVATTATVTGAIQLAFGFNPATFHHPAKVRVFHMENGAWVDRTTALDMAGKRVMGATTSLSPFALFEPLNIPPVANPGANRTDAGNLAAGAAITLTSAGSSDADGDTLTYRWTGPFPEGNGTVTGAAPTVTLPFGASQVALVVNDGETDSMAAVSNVTVTDFAITSSVVNGTVKTGQPASFTINVAPKGGDFNAAVSLGCNGLPAGLSCSFSLSSVTPGANSSAVTLTISRTTIGSMRRGNPFFALWLGLPFGVVLIRGKRRRLALLLLAIGLVVAMFACGGGGGGSGFSPQPTTSTSAATVTVTGTSEALSHSAAAQIVVGQ